MSTIRNILVSVRDADDARWTLEKAIRLAQATSANLHVVRVVHEGIAELPAAAIDASRDLRTFFLTAAETELEELVAGARRTCPTLETAAIWNAREWEGILHAAERVEAALIIKGTRVPAGFGGALRTPDDWNLLRQSNVPVLLAREQAWAAAPVVLCALDVFDDAHAALNHALLRQARELANWLGGELDLVTAFPLFEPWVGELGALRSYDDLRRDVETEIRTRVAALTAAAGIDYRRLIAEEGHAVQVIDQLVEADAASLVVLGTHARDGIKGILLGNTAERVLHRVAVDVVTIPGPAT